MTFSALTILVIALAVIVIGLAALVVYSTANRLDRLHVRCNLTWQALEGALGRRAVVARAIAAATSGTGDGSRQLVALADDAEKADRQDRETIENKLSRALSAVDIDALRPQLVAELSDAEARVLIARRFHNDAVRDTVALRGKRWVRMLHLAGTAAPPDYFEIAERAKPNRFGPRAWVRVIVLDDDDHVLLIRGHDPATPGSAFWFIPGGGVRPDESPRAAAVRELYAETGTVIDAGELRGPLRRQVSVFPLGGELIRSEEQFFAVTVPRFEPGRHDGAAAPAASVHRWCVAGELADIDAASQQVYPNDLADMLAHAVAARTG